MSVSLQDISLELTDSISTALGSNSIAVNYSNYSLPATEDLMLMRSNLHLLGLGDFDESLPYWSSSDDGENAQSVYFDNGDMGLNPKTELLNVRACRTFISSTVYALGDEGQAGGLIYNIINNLDGTYLYSEAAPADQSSSQSWSNVTDLPVGDTSTLLGSGASNTLKIIAQTGHIDSAAKLCNDLQVTNGVILGQGGYLSVNGSDIPVYVTMPKNAPNNYIYIGGTVQTEDGTKDEFIYTGTVQIRVTTDNLHTAEKKLAQEILNAVRQTLKPTKEAVFTMTNFTVVVFKHESYTELIGQSEGGLRVDLIDIYDFIIT